MDSIPDKALQEKLIAALQGLITNNTKKDVRIVLEKNTETTHPSLEPFISATIHFSLPDVATCQELLKKHAAHLTTEQRATLSSVLANFSIKEILDICRSICFCI